MGWIFLAVIIAVPAWLGITRPGIQTATRQFVGRCLIRGAAVGGIAGGVVWLAASPPWGMAIVAYGAISGGSIGSATGLIVAACWALRARLRQEQIMPS
jgi:hypothetical protein